MRRGFDAALSWTVTGRSEGRSTPLRARIFAFSLSIGIAALGAPALAQEATPVGTPVGGPATEMPPTPEWAEVVATDLANRGGMLSIDPANPATLEGQLTRIAPDGTHEVVANEGLIAPTGLAIAEDGSPYVAVFGVVGNMGQLWRLAPAA